MELTGLQLTDSDSMRTRSFLQVVESGLWMVLKGRKSSLGFLKPEWQLLRRLVSYQHNRILSRQLRNARYWTQPGRSLLLERNGVALPPGRSPHVLLTECFNIDNIASDEVVAPDALQFLHSPHPHL